MSKKLWQDLRQWSSQNTGFTQVEEDAPFLSDKDEQGSTYNSRRRRAVLGNPFVWTVLNLLLFSVTLILSSVHFVPPRNADSSLDAGTTRWNGASSDALRETSYYSPVLRDLDVEISEVKFNGSLFPDSRDSNWMRAEPSPELDAMWEHYEPKNVFAITSADLIALGGDPSTAVKLPDSTFGLGDDAYMASLDMLHKTHCLNELRKMAFEDYGEDPPIKTKRHGRIWWIHLRHCVDMLLQDQLCHADADILYYNWMDVESIPWPNFGITRKCRNWDQIHGWAEKRYVDLDDVLAMQKPTNAKLLPFERGWYELYGFDESTMYPNGKGYEW